MIKLLLLSKNAEAVSACLNSFEPMDVCCVCTDSIAELQRRLINAPFHGIILDVVATARASQKERILIQEISETYPVLRLRWDSSRKQIGGLVFGEILDKKDPLRDFVNRFCLDGCGRIFRENKRYNIHLNVLLGKDQACSEQHVEKTVTLDLSQSGCFIVTSHDWDDVTTAWIRFRELSDQTPIRVEIRNYLPWGEQSQMPGIGVKFTDLQPCQAQEIRSFCSGPS